MATADGFVHPVVPSLDNVVRPGRGGMDVPHGWREISVEPRGVVASLTIQRGHYTFKTNIDC